MDVKRVGTHLSIYCYQPVCHTLAYTSLQVSIMLRSIKTIGYFQVHHVCKILSEFALEYRTTRERVIETIQKKKAAREKKRLAKKAALLAEAAALEALQQPEVSAVVSKRPHQVNNI